MVYAFRWTSSEIELSDTAKTQDKLIPSPTPSLPEKAQISIAGDQGTETSVLKISLTHEHGDEVRLKKNAHVEVTVTAEDVGAINPKAGA
jgi:hypothetical protein